MPFDDQVLDWSLVGIQIPFARIPELYFLLRTVSDHDVLEFRRVGRMFYEAYFSSPERRFRVVLALIRHRLRIPPKAVQDLIVPHLFNNSTSQIRTTEMPFIQEVDEFLGPVELPLPSLTFVQNFTVVYQQSYRQWNILAQPFRLFPQDPFQNPLPSEAKFIGSTLGFRPVNFGAGGSGREFSETLGGNFPREQFTSISILEFIFEIFEI